MGALALLWGCASRADAPAGSAASAGGEANASAQAESAAQRRREMTWDEYYRDVEQRAHRAGGFVMWFNPPRPVRRAAQTGPDSAAPPVQGAPGAPLSGELR